MAQRGKRKARPTASSSRSTPTAKKKINLNGTITRQPIAAATDSSNNEHVKEELVKSEDEENYAPLQSSPNKTPERQASSSSLLSSIKPEASSWLPSYFFNSSPSHSHSSSKGNDSKTSITDATIARVKETPNLLRQIKSYLPGGREVRKRMRAEKERLRELKGKGRAILEEDHLSPEESARMINLLHIDDDADAKEADKELMLQSVKAEETAPVKGKDDDEKIIPDANHEPAIGMHESDSDEDIYLIPIKEKKVARALQADTIDRQEGIDSTIPALPPSGRDDVFSGETREEVHGAENSLLEARDQMPAETIGMGDEKDPQAEIALPVSDVLECGKEEIAATGEGAVQEQLETLVKQQPVTEEVLLPNDELVVVAKEDLEGPTEEQQLAEGISALKEGDVSVIAEAGDLAEVSRDMSGLVASQPVALIEEAGGQDSLAGITRDEDGDAEEKDDEIILLPTNNQTVIDLTDSASPEPQGQKVEEVVFKSVPLPRRRASGFFERGTLAQEKRLQESGGSASRIIQQLGQRAFSSSNASSKKLYKSFSGYKKRDPIFSREQKTVARGITHGKLDEILASLKKHARRTLQTSSIDDMLRKRVVLAKALGEDVTEDEVQIRHLREIIKRSTSSLRIPRRALKEQERLAQEAKLLKRRALGILGRQALPTTLLPEQEDFVNRTFARQGKVAQITGAEVASRDIAKLRPGLWLNDEVINFYMKLILKRSDEALSKRRLGVEAKKRLEIGAYDDESKQRADIMAVRDVKKIWNGIWNVWVFTSFFWEKLTTSGYSSVRAWTRKVDIFTKDLVLVPINISGAHWVCAAINMRRCRFEYYDSMHGTNRQVFSLLRTYLQSEYADKKKESAGSLLLSGWTNYVSQQSPSQANGFDCGVFATMTVEQLSRRNPHDGELKDDQTVEKFVEKSRQLAEERGSKREDEDDSHSDVDEEERFDEEEEWNFSQSNMPYLRRRMVYEIAQSALLE